MHFNQSIVLRYHSIPKINWGSFRGRREEKLSVSFRGRFRDHFWVGDHFEGCIVPGVGYLPGCDHEFPRWGFC